MICLTHMVCLKVNVCHYLLASASICEGFGFWTPAFRDQFQLASLLFNPIMLRTLSVVHDEATGILKKNNRYKVWGKDRYPANLHMA
jgi:hypothetical protein